MADEVVGSAYVVIRAITSRVRDDIKNGVKSSTSGRDLEQAGEQIGDSVGEPAGKRVSKRLRDSLGGFGRDARQDTERLGEDIGNGIGDGVNKSRLRNVLSNFKELFAKNDSGYKAGQQVGQQIASGLGSIFSIGGFKLFLFPLLVPALASLVPIVAAYVNAIIGIVASIGPALVGGAVAGIAAYGALGLAVGAVMLAFKSGAPEVDAFKKKLEPIKDQFLAIGKVIAAELLPRLGDAIQKISAVLLPILSKSLGQTGSILGNIATYFGKLFSSPFFSDSFRRVLAQLNGLLAVLGPSLGRLVAAFVIVLGSASPVITLFGRFADSISKTALAAAKANKAVDGGDGGLRKFFTEAAKAMHLWGAVVGNTVVGLLNLLHVAKPFGDAIGESMKKATQGFRDFTGSADGQKKIHDFFAGLMPVMKAADKLIGSIFVGLYHLASNPELQKNTIALLNAIRNKILPALGDLFNALLPLEPKLIKLVKAVGTFVSALAKSDGFKKFVDIVGKVDDTVARLLKNPVAAKIGGWALAILAGGAAVNFLLKPLGGLSGVLKVLLGPLSGLFKTLAKNIGLVFSAGAAAEEGGGLAGGLAALGATLGPILLVVAAVAALVVVFIVLYKKSETFRNLINSAADAIKKQLLVGFAAVHDFITKQFLPAFDSLSKTIKHAIDEIQHGGGAMTYIRQVFKVELALIVGIVKVAFKFIVDYITAVFGIIKAVIIGSMKIIQGIIDVVCGLLTGNWSQAWTGIKEIVSGAITIILGVLKGFGKIALAALKLAFRLIILLVVASLKLLYTAFSNLLPALGHLFEFIGKEALKGLSHLGSDLVDLLKAAGGKIKGLGGFFKDLGKDLIKALLKGLAVVGGFEVGFAKSIANAVISAVNSILSTLNSLLDFKIDLGIKTIHINPPDIGPIPKLRAGGRATSETLAVIGEGREPESVLPDSVLRGLLERVHQAGATAAGGSSTGRQALFGDVSVTAHDYKDFMKQMEARARNASIGGFDLPSSEVPAA